MKIRLSVSGDKAAELEEELKRLGIEIDPHSDLELIEHQSSGIRSEYLEVKDEKGDRFNIRLTDIIFVESFGRRIDVHINGAVYSTGERLYSLEEILTVYGFIRVSNSVIVAKKHIRKIKPTLSMKFVLTMSDGTLVDVTRSYYYSFKQEIGI